MASLDPIYADIGRMFKVASEVNDVNWDSTADWGEQAERLSIVAELAGRNAKVFANLNKALGGT